MRMDTVTDSPKQLLETSAIVKNMGNIAITLRVVNTRTSTLTIYPQQDAKYVNSTAYVQATQAGVRVPIQITPYKTSSTDGESAELSGFLPLTGGTLEGDLNVNGNLMIYGKSITTLIDQSVAYSFSTQLNFRAATDAEITDMLNDVFGN